ncbi:MAG: hypothetical protein V4633_07220 [Pseudomonadota bacterium]
MDISYRVVTQGVQAGADVETVAAQVAALFKRARPDIEPLLQAGRAVVKKGLAMADAAKYQAALANCGLLATIEAEDAPAAPPAAAPDLSRLLPRLRAASSAQGSQARSIPGDLAVSFYYAGPDAGPDLTPQEITALGKEADALLRLAIDNLHHAIHPLLRVQQMSLVPPDSVDAQPVGFFHYLETGSDLEASCLLIHAIWPSLQSVVKGELRIMVPTAGQCLFCGADDTLALAMMSDIGRDTCAEAGAQGLSALLYTIDADGELTQVAASVTPQASNPGGLAISIDRLLILQPDIADPHFWQGDQEKCQAYLGAMEEQLRDGDARSAVVIDADTGLVAAYTDELDCVVMLRFNPGMAAQFGWRPGTRLISCNSYTPASEGIAPDLTPGPSDTGRYGNVWPLIADLLTEDSAGLAAIKARIGEPEWQRTFELGRLWRRARPGPARDGRPLLSYRSASK